MQLTENVVEAVPPDGTATVREAPPLTVQFEGTPERATVWLPAVKLVNVTLLLIPIACRATPPSGVVWRPGRPVPVVLVVTVGGRCGVVQLTLNVALAVPPDGTLTVWEVPPLTVQFEGTPERATVWLPAVKLVNVTLLLTPIAWPGPPSTATV